MSDIVVIRDPVREVITVSSPGPRGPAGDGVDVDAAIEEHNADATNVHGIADTAALATKAEVEAKQDAATAATDAELAGETTAREAADATLTAAAAAAQATANAALPKAGGTMTGLLTLAEDPKSPLEAATRQFVLDQYAAVVNGAPEALDTLKELGDALKAAEESEESALEALTALVESKLSKASDLSDVTDAAVARANLGLGTAATKDAGAAGAAGKVLNADDPTTTDARTPKEHTHPQSDVTGLVEALAAKVPNSLVDAKGDILTATANDTPARLPAGANGRAVTADSTAATGLAYRELGAFAAWRPTGAKWESIPGRSIGSSANYTPVSGQLMLAPVPTPLLAGETYSSISFMSAANPSATTHIWFCLIDAATLKVLRSTKDEPGAWGGANVVKALELSTPYTPAVDTRAYVGVCIVGAGVGTLRSTPTLYSGLTGIAPIICGESSTGLTTPLADGVAVTAPTATAVYPYAYGS